MNIVTRKHLTEGILRFPDAADEIRAWTVIVASVRWRNFSEVRSTFTHADYVNGYVVFDLRRNRYRLITVIHYAETREKETTEGHVYIRSFLTHKEYNDPRNWDRKFGTQ